jgi:hypothetical protein
MIRKRRELTVFSLSFLDVVSCGFGAIVLLLVIIKTSEPTLIEQSVEELAEEVAALSQQTEKERSLAVQLQSQLGERSQQLEKLRLELTELEEELSLKERERQERLAEDGAQRAILRQLYEARQDLTEEMRSLQQMAVPPPSNSIIGGVPVDSEYIIFIIDTSGSMQNFAWNAVRRKMAEILQIYPQVKGIQVMNDMGDYMFSQYAGRWIRDTPARRRAILKRLSSWTPFSNSSPVEGIRAAIQRFYAVDKKISLYIFGDDFSRGSIQEVVDTVDGINRSLGGGGRRVRIHAVGFPVLLNQPAASQNVTRFAALMRRLAEDNDGSFVGLTSM